MQIIRTGLIVLLAGCLCPAFSSQSAEKFETKPTQTAPNSKGGSSSQKTDPEISKSTDDVEILSFTMGFDFKPYLGRLKSEIMTNWYPLVPDSAKVPTLKQGRVAIEFTILKDGTIRGMSMVSSSGDKDLDRAAWDGVIASRPLAALPDGFRGRFLKLRIKFSYNPSKDPPAPVPPYRPPDQ